MIRDFISALLSPLVRALFRVKEPRTASRPRITGEASSNIAAFKRLREGK